jgi:hypothetical protein
MHPDVMAAGRLVIGHQQKMNGERLRIPPEDTQWRSSDWCNFCAGSGSVEISALWWRNVLEGCSVDQANGRCRGKWKEREEDIELKECSTQAQ